MRNRTMGGTSIPGKIQVHNGVGLKTGLALEEYYDLLNEISDGLYVVDELGEILYANRALAHILGFKKPDEVIGRRVQDFIDHEPHDELIAEYTRGTGEEEISSTITTKILRSDGVATYVDVWLGKQKATNAPLRRRGIVRDITEWKTAEKELRKSEALYHSVVEFSPDAIVLTTMDGRIVTMNAKAVVLYGLQERLEPLDFSIMDFIAPEEHARGEEQFQRLIADGSSFSNEEYRLQRQDGTIFWGEASAKYISVMDDEPGVFLFLSRDISERKAAEANLKSLSVTDELTGLYNRRGFTLMAEQELAHARRSKNHMALLFFDMDKMKFINDSFGHAEGDAALQATAAIMRRTFRDSDIIARWGGDEFVVLALDIPEGCIPILVDRFHKALELHNQRENAQYEILFSVGVSDYDPESQANLQKLVVLADRAMYQEKHSKPSHSSGSEPSDTARGAR